MGMREIRAKIYGKARQLVRPTIVAIDRYSPYPLFYSFVMSTPEKRMFDRHIKNSKYYLEFGSGGSTIRVLLRSQATIYSVESSIDWIREMSKYVLIKYWNKKRLFFYHVNIGETKGWGFPAGDGSKELFPDYSSSIFETIDPQKIDTVLVDGRFRVACVLSTILHLFSNENLTIMVHDFWIREKYQVILKYVTEVDRADSLGVFKIKTDIDLNLVKKDYGLYKYIPD